MLTHSARFTLVPIGIACAVLIQGCTSFGNLERANTAEANKTQALTNQAVSNLGDKVSSATLGSDARAESLSRQQLAQASGKVSAKASKPWIGTRTIAIQSDEILPPVFSASHQINFDDAKGGRVSINVVAERLSRLTGIPVRVKGDVFSGAGSVQNRPTVPATSSAGLTAAMPMPGAASGSASVADASLTPSSIGPTDLNSIEMRWNGSLSGYLDHITGRLGVSWAYRDGVVLIERFITETFEISALTGAQDFKMSMSGSGSGTSGSGSTSGTTSAGTDVSESGKIEALLSLNKTISAIAGTVPGSNVTLSDGTASLVVTTTKDLMGRIRQIIKHENASLMRQVQLQFDIYSVTNKESNEKGIDIKLLMESLSRGASGVLASPASLTTSVSGGLSLSLFNSGNLLANGSSSIIKALGDFGQSVQHRPISVTALNRQWVRKTNLKQTGYLQETTPAPASAAGAGGLPGLKTGTVTTGDTIAVQPAILDNGTIILKFAVGLTDLLGLFDVTTGAGATFQKVQTPEVSGTNDQSTVVLKSGEVMVLTGMSRTRINNQNRSIAEGVSSILGGSKTDSRVREDFIIVVRPVLL